MSAVTAGTSLHVIGDLFADVIITAPGHPQHGGDLVLSHPILDAAGGSGLNSCSHLARSLCSNVKLTLHGSLNPNDRFGASLLDHMKTLPNMTFVNHNPTNAPTGHCVVVSSPLDRSFYTYRGCIDEFNPTINLPVSEKHHLHLTGFSNFGNLDVDKVVTLFQSVLASGGSTSLTPQWGESFHALLPLLPHVTYLICSEHEACGISGAADQNGVVKFFSSESSPDLTIVTQGGKGGYCVAAKSGLAFSFTAPNLPSPPLDPTGAGDAFAAGFLFSKIANGRSSEDGIREGCAWGGACCLVKGASTELPREHLTSLMGSVRVTPKSSQSFPTKPIHVVLDYDRTISCIEVGQFDLSSSDRNQVISRVFGGAKRLQRLEEEIAKLKSLGVIVSILSMNSSHVIQKSFTYYSPSLRSSVSKVWGFEDVPCNQIGLPAQKSVSISSIVGGPGEAAGVVFVDDARDNIRDMRENRGDVFGVLVERGRGMEDREWEVVWSKLGEWGVG